MDNSSQIDSARKQLARLREDFRLAQRALKVESKALSEAETALQDALEAQKILQAVAQTIQQQAHTRIAGVVSRCLAAVFDDPYEFRILFAQKRGKTEARLVFTRDGKDVDPLTASGGGVVDVAAFALRLSCLLLARPAVARVLVMDEPFRFVSVVYRDRVRILLETLSRELGVQFILVTHMDELRVGNVIELE